MQKATANIDDGNCFTHQATIDLLKHSAAGAPAVLAAALPMAGATDSEPSGSRDERAQAGALWLVGIQFRWGHQADPTNFDSAGIEAAGQRRGIWACSRALYVWE